MAWGQSSTRGRRTQSSGSWERHLQLVEFTYNNSYQSSIKMAPYEALYRCWCRSPIGWFELGKVRALGPDLVWEAMAKVRVICDQMLAVQSRQKVYTNHRRQDLEFIVDDMVFLWVSPMKGVMRFRKRGKLSPRYVGPFEVTERVGNVAYWLALLVEHEGFTLFSMFRCLGNIFPTHLTLSSQVPFKLTRPWLMRRRRSLSLIVKWSKSAPGRFPPSRYCGRISLIRRLLGKLERICVPSTHTYSSLEVM